MKISYFIKFDKDLEPVRIVCANWLELTDTVQRLVRQRGEPFEWMIRDYMR